MILINCVNKIHFINELTLNNELINSLINNNSITSLDFSCVVKLYKIDLLTNLFKINKTIIILNFSNNFIEIGFIMYLIENSNSFVSMKLNNYILRYIMSVFDKIVSNPNYY